MSDQAMWNPEIVELARRFHDKYEEEAKRFGWVSQTPVAFDNLPEANLQTMLCTVAAVTAPLSNRINALQVEVQRLTGERAQLVSRIAVAVAMFKQDCVSNDDWGKAFLAILSAPTEDKETE